MKRLSTSKAAPVNSDSNKSARVPCKKRVSTGILTNSKQQEKNTPKHPGPQCYCMLYKKAGMPEIKYMSNISENCFVERFDQHSVKEGLVVALVNRSYSVNYYN